MQPLFAMVPPDGLESLLANGPKKSPREKLNEDTLNVAISHIKNIEKLEKEEEKYRKRLEKDKKARKRKEEKYRKRLERKEGRLLKKEKKKDGRFLRKQQKKQKEREEKEKQATFKKEATRFLEIQKLINVLLSGKEKEIKKRLKDQEKPLNVLTKEGQSPVNCVLNNNKEHVLQLLASLKVIDLAFADSQDCTPLHALFKREDWQIIPEWPTMYAILIEYFNGKGIEEKKPFEAIEEVEKEKRIRIINAQDKNGWTPLHWAVKQNNVDVLPVLYANGADVDSNLFEPGSDTPLEIAYSDKMKNVLERLKATKRKKNTPTLETKKSAETTQSKKTEKSSYPPNKLQPKKEEQPPQQSARKKIPVRSSERTKRAGDKFNTLRVKSWSKSLKIPGQPEQKPDESVVCSSYPPSTFHQPTFNKMVKRMNRSSSVAIVSPSLSIDERLLLRVEEGMKETPEQRKIRKQQQIIESVQSQSCPVLPLAGIGLRSKKKYGRTRRSKSAMEKLGKSQVKKKEVKDKKDEIAKLPPARPLTPQRSYSICFGEKRPPIPNYETKPKTSQTSQSFPCLPALQGGNSQNLQED